MLGFILEAQTIAARFLSPCDWIETAMEYAYPMQSLVAVDEADAQKYVDLLREAHQSHDMMHLALEQVKTPFLEGISRHDVSISLSGLIVRPADDGVFCHPSFRKIMLSLNPAQLILRDVDDASLLQISQWLPLLKDLKGLSLHGWFQDASLRVLAYPLSSFSQLHMLSIDGPPRNEGGGHLSRGIIVFSR